MSETSDTKRTARKAPPKTGPRRGQAREEILKAADTLFGQTGFDVTTTREIAEACGVNKALIHYHFATKDALLEAVLERYYVKLGETVLGSLGAEGTLRERAHGLIHTYVDFLGQNANFSKIIQREASAGRHVELVGGRMLPLFEIGSAMLAEALPATRAGEMAAQQLLVSFYGMVVAYFSYSHVLERLLGTDPLSPDNLAARKAHLCRMFDVVLASLTADSASVEG